MNKIPWLKPRARSLATNYLLGMQSNGPDKSITISPFYFMNGSFFHFSMIFWKTLMKMDNNRDIWFLLFTDFVSFINVRKSSKNRNWSVVFLNISRCFGVVCELYECNFMSSKFTWKSLLLETTWLSVELSELSELLIHCILSNLVKESVKKLL